VGEVEITECKNVIKKLIPRVLKAVFWCLLIGVGLLLLKQFLSLFFFNFYPESQKLFEIFAWTIVFFAFLIKLSEGTIFKYAFMIGRSFFLILYFIYATNGGVLTVEASEFFQATGMHIQLEFTPLVVLLVLSSLLTMVKDVVAAVNFLNETSA
jgi:hypothetical protein